MNLIGLQDIESFRTHAFRALGVSKSHHNRDVNSNANHLTLKLTPNPNTNTKSQTLITT